MFGFSKLSLYITEMQVDNDLFYNSLQTGIPNGLDQSMII